MAQIPKPTIKMIPGTSPTLANTDGKERIPREIVSAIIKSEVCHHVKVLYLTSACDSSPNGSTRPVALLLLLASSSLVFFFSISLEFESGKGPGKDSLDMLLRQTAMRSCESIRKMLFRPSL